MEGFELRGGGGANVTRKIGEHNFLTPETETNNNIDVDAISKIRHSLEDKGGREGIPEKLDSLAYDLVRGGVEVLKSEQEGDTPKSSYLGTKTLGGSSCEIKSTSDVWVLVETSDLGGFGCFPDNMG